MTDPTQDNDATVLVVDDEPDLVSLYAAWLADSYDVRRATGGEEAIATLDDSFDVALLDRRMPGVSGDDVLAEIRDRGIDCRVAMITAVDPDVDILDMAIDDYFVKPVDEHDLRTAVEVLLQRRRYDEKRREFLRFAAKRAAIESADGDHAADPEYRELLDRMEALRESIDATADELAPADYEAAFRNLE